MRSLEDSLQRLGTYRIDILLVHDLDVWTHKSEEARRARLDEFMAGGYRAMVELREQGAVRAIGAGVNETAACQDLAERGDFDCFLLAGRYTLLEQAPLDEVPPLVRAAPHRALIIGGAYNTGILATGAIPGAYFQICAGSPRDHGTRAPDRGSVRAARRAAAERSAAVPARPPGRRDGDPGHALGGQVAQNVEIFAPEIAADLWAELKHEGLLRADAPTP